MIDQDAVLSGPREDLRNEPPHVRQALAALGRLLGAAVSEPPRNLQSFVAGSLGCEVADTASVGSALHGVDAPLVHVAVARLLEHVVSPNVSDDTGNGSPGYYLVTVDVDEQVSAPEDLAACLPANDVFAFDSVLVLTWQRTYKIALYVRRADHQHAHSALSAFLATARGPGNFYRGKTLRVDADNQGVEFTPVTRASAHRTDLVLPAQVWAEVDANVHGLVEHGEVLAAAGLGASRGVLIVGGPGVGKTALCRVIATELPPTTTVLLVDGGITPRGLGLLYESLPRLAPAVVFLDDMDLLAGDRRNGTGGPALRELLTHLDGFAPNAAVLTVATTNDMTVIDPALVRAGRFDAVIEIGRPDRASRTRILEQYLRPFGSVDVTGLAARTDGATGSDLREIVRRAVLEAGAELTEAHLLDVVATGRWKPAAPTGQYL